MTPEEIIGMARAIGRLTNALAEVERQLAEKTDELERLKAERS